MTEQTTALTVVERAQRALVLAKTEDELRELAAKSADITIITNADGREQVHSSRMVLKNLRVDIQNRGKEARDDATKFSRAVIAEEKRFIALIEPEEDRLQKLQDAWDDAIEAEKQAKIDAELKRVADLQERVAELRGNRMLVPTSGAELIAGHIGDVESIPVDDSFEEFREQAESAKAEGLGWLRALYAAAVAHETEQARIKAEREELEQLRAAQAKADAEAQAIRDAAAKKLADERAQFEREQAEARKAKEEEEGLKREQARLASIQKPADHALLSVLAGHYNVPTAKVVEWILAMDLSKDIAA